MRMRRQLETLWSILQVGALASIVFVSVQANVRGRPAQPVMVSEAETTSPAATNLAVRTAPLRRVSANPQKNITSRVVPLPNPNVAASTSPLELEVETRQMRFERSGFAEVRAVANMKRGPASVGSAPAWNLLEIRRKQGEGWESVPLVRNDVAQTLGSVFVELEEGLNEFVVIYGDVKGKKLSYPVRVQHSRKSTT